VNFRPFEPLSASVQEYDDQAYQNIYYVAESIDDAKVKLRFDRSWIRKKREELNMNFRFHKGDIEGGSLRINIFSLNSQ
jgi:hypothetical protein